MPGTVKGYLAGGPRLKSEIDTGVLSAAAQANWGVFSHHDEVRLPIHTPVSRQVGGSCVANAFVDGLEILQGIRDPAGVTQLSRLAAYAWSRARHGKQHLDDGTFPYYMADQLRLVGVVEEVKWPSTRELLLKQPPNHLIIEASDNRIDGIHAIEEKGLPLLDMLEWALRGGCPVEGAAPVHASFQDVGPNQIVDVQPSPIEGNHAMLVVGVRIYGNGNREYLLRNSWGEDWGTGGYTWVTSAYVLKMFDFYLLTLMKDLVK